jgi:hypothetical protein
MNRQAYLGGSVFSFAFLSEAVGATSKFQFDVGAFSGAEI